MVPKTKLVSPGLRLLSIDPDLMLDEELEAFEEEFDEEALRVGAR
jgi:hypothetical protein